MMSTAYWLGDAPAEPLVLVPTRDGEPIDLTAYTGVAATLTGPTTPAVPVKASIAPAPDLELHVQLPTLSDPGLNWLRLTLTGEGVQSRLDAVPVIVQDDDGWHTLQSARAEWPDANGLEDRRLFTLLEVAKGEVIAYAPALPDALVPISYREAQLLQARNRLNASRVDPSGSAGGDTFSLTPFPLDWAVKQILRPQRGLRGVR